MSKFYKCIFFLYNLFSLIFIYVDFKNNFLNTFKMHLNFYVLFNLLIIAIIAITIRLCVGTFSYSGIY